MVLRLYGTSWEEGGKQAGREFLYMIQREQRGAYGGSALTFL